MCPALSVVRIGRLGWDERWTGRRRVGGAGYPEGMALLSTARGSVPCLLRESLRERRIANHVCEGNLHRDAPVEQPVDRLEHGRRGAGT